MQLVINEDDRVKIIQGTYQGKYGIISKCILSEDGQSIFYNVTIRKDGNPKGHWPFETVQIPPDDLKKLRF